MGWSKGSSRMRFVDAGSHILPLFLWGHIKSKVYATKPLNLSQLKERIRTTCCEVGKEMLQNVGEACVKRWMKVVESGGGHVEVHN